MQVDFCRREDVGKHIASADLAVPLMARLDATMLDRAPHLKAILQYGVGVEGIDIPAVRPPPCEDIHLSSAMDKNTVYKKVVDVQNPPLKAAFVGSSD